jgi:hypothetical protein
MSRQGTCANCEWYFKENPKVRTGYCRARSPLPIMIGVQQAAQLPGLRMNGHGQAQPVINGYFPPTSDHIWCGDWQQCVSQVVDLQPVKEAANG